MWLIVVKGWSLCTRRRASAILLPLSMLGSTLKVFVAVQIDEGLDIVAGEGEVLIELEVCSLIFGVQNGSIARHMSTILPLA